MQKKIKEYKVPIIIIILLIFITIITIKVLQNKSLIIDELAYNLLVSKLRNSSLTKIMKFITSLSNTPVITVIAIILFLVIKNKKVSLTIPTNLVLIATLNQILKLIFQRERPIGYRLLEIGGYSFPSGHAMASTAFYGLLIYLSYKYIKNKNLKIFLITINTIVIILVGISRIYLGVHYCSDVLVGISISIIYLIIYTKILTKYKVLN